MLVVLHDVFLNTKLCRPVSYCSVVLQRPGCTACLALLVRVSLRCGLSHYFVFLQPHLELSTQAQHLPQAQARRHPHLLPQPLASDTRLAGLPCAAACRMLNQQHSQLLPGPQQMALPFQLTRSDSCLALCT